MGVIVAIGAFYLLTSASGYYRPGTMASVGVTEVDGQLVAALLSLLAGWLTKQWPGILAWLQTIVPDLKRSARVEATVNQIHARVCDSMNPLPPGASANSKPPAPPPPDLSHR